MSRAPVPLRQRMDPGSADFTKFSKSEAAYKDAPDTLIGRAYPCSQCRWFIPAGKQDAARRSQTDTETPDAAGGLCTIVDGAISPSGTSDLWQKQRITTGRPRFVLVEVRARLAAPFLDAMAGR